MQDKGPEILFQNMSNNCCVGTIVSYQRYLNQTLLENKQLPDFKFLYSLLKDVSSFFSTEKNYLGFQQSFRSERVKGNESDIQGCFQPCLGQACGGQ